MDYITITGHFDDLDQAEHAATAIKNKVKNVVSVSLKSKRSKNAYYKESDPLVPNYFLATNNLNNPTISGTSVGFPSAYPINVVPNEFAGIENSYKKTKLIAKIPSSEEGLASSIILANSGHYVSY